MRFTNLISLTLLAKATAAVTQVLDVMEVVHQDAVVLIDEDGTPWSTSYAVSTSYSTAATPRTISSSSSSSSSSASTSSSYSSHAHSSSVVEITVASNTPTTVVTMTKTVTLGSSAANYAADNSVVSVSTTTSSQAVVATTASASTSTDPVTTKETSASSSAPAAVATGVFSGDGTYYDVGLGACGWTNYDYDLVVAVNADQFGAQSNGNPICGRRVVVTGPSGSVTVTVVDKCPGCAYGSLDLSPSAFAKIADMSAGRVGISWYFA